MNVHHVGHNLFSLGLLSGASAGRWVLGGGSACIETVQMFLIGPGGQSCRELWSEDWWAQSEHEVYGA
jgi:hypothetical protein